MEYNLYYDQERYIHMLLYEPQVIFQNLHEAKVAMERPIPEWWPAKDCYLLFPHFLNYKKD